MFFATSFLIAISFAIGKRFPLQVPKDEYGIWSTEFPWSSNAQFCRKDSGGKLRTGNQPALMDRLIAMKILLLEVEFKKKEAAAYEIKAHFM